MNIYLPIKKKKKTNEHLLAPQVSTHQVYQP